MAVYLSPAAVAGMFDNDFANSLNERHNAIWFCLSLDFQQYDLPHH
ncbi:hypothetical protein COI_2723 [Mannheimia haemolytica serotype A2 str. OVINE]|nr:hypothetical protein COI_2723 [Mannheimia haemolytica serotype A2 str. OVINE]